MHGDRVKFSRHLSAARARVRSCGILHTGKGTGRQNVFTPSETNCACTILLNLSTTLPRLHSLMSFRSGGPGQARNEVWTDGRGRVYPGRRGACRFGFCPNLHTLRGALISAARKIVTFPPSPFFSLPAPRMDVGLTRQRVPIRHKYTEDVIGHRRSLCGLASQGSHYPHLVPFSWRQPFLVGPSSTNYARPPIAPTAKEFNRPRGKKMGI